MATNLFAKAKETAPAKSSSKQKELVTINDKAFHTTLNRLAKVNRELDKLKAESAVLTAEVKEVGINTFSKLFKNGGKNPGSFNIASIGVTNLEEATFMFVPTDKYITIDEERYNELNELTKEYGNVAEEKTVFELDAELIDKYGEILSDLIMSSSKIPAEVKEKLIIAKTSYSIKKGTIDNASEIAKQSKVSITEILEEVKPIYQIKGLKLV